MSNVPVGVQIEKKPTISIIIPVYQVEQYIRECVDSVLAQTFTDWEMLLVDDGSVDRSGEICDEYAACDERIRVIHQENGGLSAARNTGLDNMRGEYVTFIDSDDVLLSNQYFQILMDTLIKTEAQASVAGHLDFNEEDSHPEPRLSFDGIIVSEGRDVFYMLPLPPHVKRENYYYANIWGRLFKKECFEGLRFTPGRISEDDAIAARLLYPLERIAISGHLIYGYRQREAGIMKSSDYVKAYSDRAQTFMEHREFFISKEEIALANKSEGTLHTLQIMFLLHCEDRITLNRIPEKLRPDPITVMRNGSRNQIWKMIRRNDPDCRSIGAISFLELERVRRNILLSLVCSYHGMGKRPPWRVVSRHLEAVLSMAENEDVQLPACMSIASYDECPDFVRKRFDECEELAMASLLRKRHSIRVAVEKNNLSTARKALKMCDSVLTLYTKAWYRNIGDLYSFFSSDDGCNALPENDNPTSKDIALSLLKRLVMMRHVEEKIRIADYVDLLLLMKSNSELRQQQAFECDSLSSGISGLHRTLVGLFEGIEAGIPEENCLEGFEKELQRTACICDGY